MPSAVARGQYWQARTKRWLERQGYVVVPLQLMAWINTPHGFRPMKRDALGSDLLAVSAERALFVQVKGGDTRRSNLAAAREAFRAFPLPPGAQQVVVLWPPFAREPDVEIVATGPQGPQHPVIVPARRQPKALPLFQAARRMPAKPSRMAQDA